MARARNLKPSLFKNELLGQADPLLTLLFESLWCLADRDGRLEDRPLRIKAETFPYREGVNCDSMLTELQSMGFIERYEVRGLKLIQICKFAQHQSPHSTEKPSEYPAPLTKVLPLNNESVTSLNTDSLNTDSLIPDSLNTAKRAKRSKGEYTEDFEQAWALYPQRPGANKQQSFKAWSARIASGVDVEDLIAGVKRYAAYCKAMNRHPDYIKQPATFFGPDEHFRSDWTVPPQTAAPSFESARDRTRRETIEALTGSRHASSDFIDIN